MFSLKLAEARSGACHPSNHSISATDKRVSRHAALQGSSKELTQGSENIVPSLAYYFWQDLSAIFLQPGALTSGNPVLISCHINLGKEREREKK